ncbi:MAG: hypothetical protein H6621_04440 [Halobacteriovoraceae bacterium]|nr:hypothetical protein [Halobacteriovoraceae bacterium]
MSLKDEYINFYKENKSEVLILSFSFICFFVLSLFRFPKLDEALYLKETSFIAAKLANFEWIGSEVVGTHGFFNKVFVALLFLVTGPSVIVATIFSIITIIASGFLFLKILKYLGFSKEARIISLILLLFNYQTLQAATTFLREGYALFAFLLFVYWVFKKASPLLVGLALVLILDTREHIFYQISIGYVLWIFYFNFDRKNKGSSFLSFCKIIFKTYLLPIIYLLVSFFTPLFPFNEYNTYVIKLLLSDFGIITNQNGMHFLALGNLESTEGFVQNMWMTKAAGKYAWLQKIMFSPYTKIFYPRFFSYQGLPKVLGFVALIGSFFYINKKSKNNDSLFKEKLFILFVFWSYFITFYLQWGHGRYYFVITPLFLIFSVNYLLDRTKVKKSLYVAFVFLITIGLMYEVNYLLPKMTMSFLAMLLFFIAKKYQSQNLARYFCMTISLFSLGTYVMAQWNLSYGQLINSHKWGYFLEGDAISQFIRDNVGEKNSVLLNDSKFRDSLAFYEQAPCNVGIRGIGLFNFLPEYKWKKRYNCPYDMIYRTEKPEDKIKNYNNFVWIISKIPGEKFKNEELKQWFSEKPQSFSLLAKREFKNKEVFIYQRTTR